MNYSTMLVELRKKLVDAIIERDKALAELHISLKLLLKTLEDVDASALKTLNEFDAQALKDEQADLANDHEKVADMLDEDTLEKSDDMGLDANNER